MANNTFKKRTILCVDDDHDDLILLREAVAGTEQAFNFKEAHNGREALDYLQQARITAELPCLIILDINMPLLNGRETLAIIKNDDLLKNIPTVVFTTSFTDADRMYCKQFATDLVSKPFSFKELKHTVITLLGYCSAFIA